MKLTIYKFRAESFADIAHWHSTLDRLGAFMAPVIVGSHLADCTCQFTSSMNIDEVRRSMIAITECQVMAETLALAEHYTGERSAVSTFQFSTPLMKNKSALAACLCAALIIFTLSSIPSDNPWKAAAPGEEGTMDPPPELEVLWGK